MTSTLIYEELDNPAVKEVAAEEMRIGMQIVRNRANLSDAEDHPDLANLIANGQLRVDNNRTPGNRTPGFRKVAKSCLRSSVGFYRSRHLRLSLPYNARVLSGRVV